MLSLEALDTGGPSLKRLPLLPLVPAAKKPKKEPKTYEFDLQLPEPNDESYPDFSWTELVKETRQKELEEKKQKGEPLLDPCGSSDEEELKAMAARFDEKYGHTGKTTKKKRKRLEDDYDKGAGYDESDSFIDNTDAYDELVPRYLEPKCGGFYINSGPLDSKRVELSEDEEEQVGRKTKGVKKKEENVPKKQDKIPGLPKLQKQKKAKPVGVDDSTSGPPKLKAVKQQKAKANQISRSVVNVAENNSGVATSHKKRPRQISSSNSSSSSSSASADDSSSSSKDAQEGNDAKKPKTDSDTLIVKTTTVSPTGKKALQEKPKNVGKNNAAFLERNIGVNISIKPTNNILSRNRKVMKGVPPPNSNAKRKVKVVPGMLTMKSKSPFPLPPATITPATITKTKASNSLIPNRISLPNISSSSAGTSVSRVASTAVIQSTKPPSSSPPMLRHQSTSGSIVRTSAPSLVQTSVPIISPEIMEIYSSLMPKPKSGVGKTAAGNTQAEITKISAASVTPDGRSLPKLTHKNDLKKSHPPSPPSSAFPSSKQMRINLKHGVTGNISQLPTPSSSGSSSIPSSGTNTYTSPSAYLQHTAVGGVPDMTKMHKALSNLGPGITVTEVKDRIRSGTSDRSSSTLSATGMYKANATGQSLPHSTSATPSPSPNYTSVITSLHPSLTSSLSLTSHQKTAQLGVTSSSSPLQSLGSDLSDRFNANSFTNDNRNTLGTPPTMQRQQENNPLHSTIRKTSFHNIHSLLSNGPNEPSSSSNRQ